MAAFNAYADIMPHNCTLLVILINTVQGVKKMRLKLVEMRANGSELRPFVRFGRFGGTQYTARKLLDDAVFKTLKLLLVISLDEKSLKIKSTKGRNYRWA